MSKKKIKQEKLLKLHEHECKKASSRDICGELHRHKKNDMMASRKAESYI